MHLVSLPTWKISTNCDSFGQYRAVCIGPYNWDIRIEISNDESDISDIPLLTEQERKSSILKKFKFDKSHWPINARQH